MAGLLAALDASFAGGDIDVSVQAQAVPLGDVTAAVRALMRGPDQLVDLEGAIGALPVPPALTGLAGLPDLLGGLSLDADLASMLEPLLGPLRGVGSVTASVQATARLAATLGCMREVLQLVTGQALSGPSGMPSPAEVFAIAGRRNMPPGTDASIEDIDEQIARFELLLADVGPRLDAERIVALLRQAGPRWIDLRKYPQIPLLSDVVQVAGVAVTWSAMTPAQLTRHVGEQLRLLEEVIARPRRRVADPLIAQAEAASLLPAAVSSAAADLPALLGLVGRRLTERPTGRGGSPDAREIATLRRHVDALETAAQALVLPDRPLGGLDDLVTHLELQLIRAVRVVHPGLDTGLLTARLEQLAGTVPAADPNLFAPAVEAVDSLDLSFLTGPVGSVRDAVDGAVGEVRAAMDGVRDTLTGALAPLADALDVAVGEAGLGSARTAIEAFPGEIEAFVDTQVRPLVDPLRTAVAAAVEAVSTAADAFDPAALVQPLRAALQGVSELAESPAVGSTIAQVQQALESAVEVAETVDFGAAADETVALLDEIREKLAAIDPLTIPEPALPVVRQAIEAVANIDLSAEVATPVVRTVQDALGAGPLAILAELERQAAALRERLERFQPSAAIAGPLQAPFDEMFTALESFRPSSVLARVSEALAGAADQVRLADPEPLIAPLTAAHARLNLEAAKLRPSALVAPLEQELEAALARLFEVTGADAALDGLGEVMASVREWVELADRVRTVLDRIADWLSQPGDPGAAVDALVDALVAPLDGLDVDALRPRFAALEASATMIRRDRIAADITRSLRSAQQAVPPVLGAGAAGDELRAIAQAAAAFPLSRLEESHPTRATRTWAQLVRRLRDVTSQLSASATDWDRLSTDIDVLAPRLQARLTPYARLMVIDGADVFADCLQPASRAEVIASVRVSARESLALPATAVLALFTRLAPHVSAVASGLSALIGSVHARLDEVSGAAGVGGLASAIEEAAELIRDVDLSPLTGPLDAVFLRLQTALSALDPHPLAEALRAAAAAVAGLLDLSTLVAPQDVRALDDAYAAAVGKLAALQPRELLGGVDEEYRELLQPLLALLELPARLRALVESVGTGLGDAILAELARVEVAFDAMLRAIPLEGFPASGGISVQVRAEVSVGAGG